MRYLFVALLLAAATPLTTPALAQDNAPTISGTRLDFSVQAELQVAPDVASMSGGVITQGQTATEAREANAKQIDAVFKALRAIKIPENDIQTQSITINPNYVYADNQPPKIKGYQASNNLTVKIRDKALIAKVIDQLILNGINQFSGPTFSLENPEPYLNKARAQAMAQAQSRAKLYADGAGLKVKRLVQIAENQNINVPQPVYAMAKMAMADAAGSPEATATNVATGQITVGITVNVVYELD
jgi:hypothetical protein